MIINYVHEWERRSHEVRVRSHDGTADRRKVRVRSHDGTAGRRLVRVRSHDGTAGRRKVRVRSHDGTDMGADTKRQVRNPRKCPIRTRIARKTRFQSERSNPKPHVHAYTWITIHSQGCESVLKQACAGTPNRAGSLIAHPPFPPTCKKSTNRPFRTRWLAPHILTGIFFCFRTLSAAN